jgi:Trypsin-like peptidase domain
MKAFRIVALFCIFTLEAHASSFDPSRTVLAVHELKLFGAVFGTAACLDAKCRYLLTNAHVAILASPHAIHGDPVVQKLLATGPHDDGAVMEPGEAGEAAYNPLHDIAVYELGRPMKGFQGMPFSLEPLADGDQVEIIGFPGRTIGMASFYRKLTTWQATYFANNPDGCLLFKYEVSDTGGKIRPGTSGGIVVRNGAIVGILRGIARSELIAEAVPISSLEEFLSKMNPYLHAQLFPQAIVVEPHSLDAFPPWTAPVSTPGVLERRTAEPDDVQRVREKAQALYDSMKYLIARQFFSWSEGGPPEEEATYDLKVRDGVEVFTDGKHEYAGEIPFPEIGSWVLPGDLWLNAPRYANNDLSLRIRHAGQTTVNNKPIDVYQWQAPGPEPMICKFDEYWPFPLFKRDIISDVGCSGEIWLSAEGDIVRISEAYDRPVRKWSHYESIIVYGRVVLDGESHLVPTTISTRVQYGRSKMLYCDSIFSNYKLWGSQIRLVPSGETTQ